MAITSRQQADMGEPGTIHITYGYSREHRPDLKQFMVDLMCSKDGDIPFYKMAQERESLCPNSTTMPSGQESGAVGI
jgi:transposase